MSKGLSPSEPKVTVFMAVYNREAFVGDAVRSVLAQTFRDFELLIIDDGSTDRTVEIVERFRDPRIRLLRHETNRGIPVTRNHGLLAARGGYFAILDSDDTAFPRRLELQTAFLDANPKVAGVGSWALRIEADGRPASPAIRPWRPRDIRARIPFATCFKNPTMTARTAAMREFGYREEFVICQDIDLWNRVSVKYALANLPRFLVRYRLGGTSHQDDELATRLKKQATADQLRDLALDFDDEDLDRHHRLRNPKNFRFDREYADWCEDWLMRLLAANEKARLYPEPEFRRAAAERWWRLALVARSSVPVARFSRQRTFRRELAGVLGGVVRLNGRRVASRFSFLG